ncbi:MAG: hypothetical protein WBN88_13045, partial [Anderseniella sp.]
LTDFSRLPARHASRRGLSDHKWSITTSGGRENPVSDGPNPSIWCVVALSLYYCIALRTAAARVADFDSVKRVNSWFFCYNCQTTANFQIQIQIIHRYRDVRISMLLWILEI